MITLSAGRADSDTYNLRSKRRGGSVKRQIFKESTVPKKKSKKVAEKTTTKATTPDSLTVMKQGGQHNIVSK